MTAAMIPRINTTAMRITEARDRPDSLRFRTLKIVDISLLP